ncbi:MAG: hypothetical protein GY778_28495 [bacterium]|nr:hypothetical protein [bacterium]
MGLESLNIVQHCNLVVEDVERIIVAAGAVPAQGAGPIHGRHWEICTADYIVEIQVATESPSSTQVSLRTALCCHPSAAHALTSLARSISGNALSTIWNFFGEDV